MEPAPINSATAQRRTRWQLMRNKTTTTTTTTTTTERRRSKYDNEINEKKKGKEKEKRTAQSNDRSAVTVGRHPPTGWL